MILAQASPREPRASTRRALPFCPCGIWQAYTSSVVLFNELLFDEPEAHAAGIARDKGWLGRALVAYGSAPMTRRARIETLQADGPVRVWRTPFFGAPLM